MPDPLSHSLARTVSDTRRARGLTVAALASRSGVSRAMIAKVEQGTSQPTASLLGRLSAALGLTLSELVARAEGSEERLVRREDQPTWTDPETGYTRRTVSPGGGRHLDLVEVELPPGARVDYPREAYTFTQHQIWVLGGRLRFEEGAHSHDLEVGDCLELGVAAACAFVNATDEVCRYLVVVVRRPG